MLTSSTALPQNTRLENNCWMSGAISASGPHMQQPSETRRPAMKRRRKAMKTIKTMIKVMASRWRNRVPPHEKRGAGTNEVCPHCGAQFTPSQRSLREMVLAAICGSMLLLILVPAGWMAEQWIENQGHRILDRMTWHEPLDNWSL